MAAKQLAVCVYVDGKPYGPGEVSARIAKKITNDKVWVTEDEATEPAPAAPPAAPPVDDAASVYAGVDKADLEAEVAKRNETRDDDKKIVVAADATEDEIVEALDADDAAAAAVAV